MNGPNGMVVAILGSLSFSACVAHPDVAPSSQHVPESHRFEVDVMIREHRGNWVLAMITLRNNTDDEVAMDSSRFDLHSPPPVVFTISQEASFGWKPLAMPPSLMPHGLARGTRRRGGLPTRDRKTRAPPLRPPGGGCQRAALLGGGLSPGAARRARQGPRTRPTRARFLPATRNGPRLALAEATSALELPRRSAETTPALELPRRSADPRSRAG